MFGLILACAFAADTPKIIAKTLKPPIKARFIRTPPFRQENATLFIGSINNNKFKEADGRRRRIFGAVPGKSSSTLPHLFLQGAQPRTISAAALSFTGVRRRPSIIDALSPGPGLPAPRRGPCQRGFGLQKPRLPAITSCTHISKVRTLQFSCMRPLRRCPSARTRGPRRLGWHAD